MIIHKSSYSINIKEKQNIYGIMKRLPQTFRFTFEVPTFKYKCLNTLGLTHDILSKNMKQII